MGLCVPCKKSNVPKCSCKNEFSVEAQAETESTDMVISAESLTIFSVRTIARTPSDDCSDFELFLSWSCNLKLFQLRLQLLDFCAQLLVLLRPSFLGLCCVLGRLFCFAGGDLLREPPVLLILWHLAAVLPSTTETRVRASYAKAAGLGTWGEAHATWRITARKAARNVATVELNHAATEALENVLEAPQERTADALEAPQDRSADLYANHFGALNAFLQTSKQCTATAFEAIADPAKA